ncbi:hypothetical protein L7F22_030566 [Adiantum nelumboides]|nr:hypothetical protein [Adiantum nelumboides]
MTRRNIGIINFPVKSKPQDLIEEVQRQELKLTWPQLLHLSPRMRRQWSKMVSTRRSKNVNTLKAQVLEDALLVLVAQIGQRVSREYVDGEAQVCVISEKMMHKLRLEVSGPSRFKGNNVSVKYVGVVTVCGIQVGVDMYVLLARGEGYPIISGRPWLIAMNARQDWESRTLLLKPPRKEGKSIQTIVYNVKEGRKESSELETLEDEWSTEDSSSMAEVTSSVSDSESEKASLLEAMAVVLTRPTTQDGGSIKETLSDEKIEDMLSTHLSKEERKEFEVMLQKNSPLFIVDYNQAVGCKMKSSACGLSRHKAGKGTMSNLQIEFQDQTPPTNQLVMQSSPSKVEVKVKAVLGTLECIASSSKQSTKSLIALEYPRLSKFCFSIKEVHEEYGLSLEGKLPKDLSDKDIPDEEWLSVFKCMNKKSTKLFLNHVRETNADKSSHVLELDKNITKLLELDENNIKLSEVFQHGKAVVKSGNRVEDPEARPFVVENHGKETIGQDSNKLSTDNQEGSQETADKVEDAQDVETLLIIADTLRKKCKRQQQEGVHNLNPEKITNQDPPKTRAHWKL